jgi:hypothetical protein
MIKSAFNVIFTVILSLTFVGCSHKSVPTASAPVNQDAAVRAELAQKDAEIAQLKEAAQSKSNSQVSANVPSNNPSIDVNSKIKTIVLTYIKEHPSDATPLVG